MYSNIFLLLFFCYLQSNGLAKTFSCLDGCECDTSDRSIDCTNNPDRKYLSLPKEPMLGYGLIGLANTDLMAIHIKGTPNFHCSSLQKHPYRTIEVMSDCKPIDKKNKDSFGDESQKCDFNCKMQNYFVRLWKLVKHKYKEWTQDSAFFDFIHKMFEQITTKISSFF
uniref:Uncharacterized protein n=1 Tax=Ditylenchus dipsaci TaxID=166011 RepID=A0A915E7H5_9BILA